MNSHSLGLPWFIRNSLWTSKLVSCTTFSFEICFVMLFCQFFTYLHFLNLKFWNLKIYCDLSVIHLNYSWKGHIFVTYVGICKFKCLNACCYLRVVMIFYKFSMQLLSATFNLLFLSVELLFCIQKYSLIRN